MDLVFCSRTCDFRYHKKQKQLLYGKKWYEDVPSSENEHDDSSEPDVRHKHHTFEGKAGNDR